MEWIRKFVGASCFLNGHIALGLSVHSDHGNSQAICARCGCDIVFDGDDWRRCAGPSQSGPARQG